MDILESIIAGEDTNGSGKTRVHQRSNKILGMDSIDDRICVCNKCKRVWQKPISGVPKKSFSYYEDFPTIGKKRKTCPKCNQ
tara:strand:+ start:379 stop:624 length:246 start_codon:yes stop_codon:yes gene_type:complete